MEVRRRKLTKLETFETKKAKQFIETFDAFPKLPKECKKSTAGGGVVTIFTILAIILLVWSELWIFWHSKFTYTYEVDDDPSSKLQINIDITVATRCEYTSLDLLDITGADQPVEGDIRYERTHFTLYNEDLQNFKTRRLVTTVLRDHPLPLHEMMWYRYNLFTKLAKERNQRSQLQQSPLLDKSGRSLPYNACRMMGSIFVKKVIGNMHIIAGKPLRGFGNLHIHLSILPNGNVLNFSHRINHLSFGPRVGDALEPLETLEVFSTSIYDSFRYVINIVPTRIAGMFFTSDTYQYAATVKNHSIDPSSGNNGLPGIIFQYDTFPLRVKVTEQRELLGTFLARLAALVGGLFASVDLLRQVSCGVPDLIWHSRAARGLRLRWLSRTTRYKSIIAGSTPSSPLAMEPSGQCPLDPDSDT